MGDDGSNYTRPKEGFRFEFGGMKTNSVPDSLPPNKYPYAQNIRAVNDSSVRTRPGLVQLFPTTGGITDIRSYSALKTDNLPRLLTRNANDSIWLGKPSVTSANVGSLAGSGLSNGASMIPFRPAQSPNPWMYIANGSDYQKFSAPGVADAVTQQKVGIAEPQSAPDAYIGAPSFGAPAIVSLSTPTAGAYTQGGTAGAPGTSARITDTVGLVLADPIVPLTSNSISSFKVGSSSQYHRGTWITINGVSEYVLDVFAAYPTAINIAAIFYFSGSAGRCIIVPSALGVGPSISDQSVYTQNLLSSLRRGALIQFNTSELCYVRSVTEGPNGTICIETSTVGTITNANNFTIYPAVQVLGPVPVAGQAITAPDITSTVTTGVGTLTSALTNFFAAASFSFLPDDILHFSINVDALQNLNEIKILFDVGDGTFTQNFYYYTVRPNDITAGVQNTLTQLGAAQLVSQRATIDEEVAAETHNQGTTASSAQTTPGNAQWSDIFIPLSELTRVGSDQTKSLQTVNHVQFLFNASGTINVLVGEFDVQGTIAADVGTNGAPYLYRVRPRSSVTGVKGNPSPAIRYGLNPRRQSVLVLLPSAAYDSQIDTWDIFRYGGSITSWRKIGQTASSNTSFQDTYGDDVALAGEELEFDNLEPWPSIDIPLNATATVTGTTALVTISGTTTALRLLPGNLVRLGGVNVYTLWVRPTLVSGSTYLFQFVENAGAQTSIPLYIYEPQIARQFLPYMWGPDAAGTVFAVGDPLRPGTLYYAKNYAPDAAPDSYNLEITPPSEPLIGGEILDGLSFVASTERWWALYPQSNNPLQRYSVIQQPITRGLAAPWGHCNDGKNIYWWAKDGIYSSNKGSLTDEDLYNIFPHDGVAGANFTYNGHTVFAPDYSRASTFRLAYCNHYLYAVYQEASGGNYCTLVLDTRRGAWSTDVNKVGITNNPVSVYYALEQQEGTLLTPPLATYPMLVAGTIAGSVLIPQVNTNDYSLTGITAIVDTMEWDGGDLRAGENWGDLWIDCIPQAKGSAVTITPMAFGAGIAAPTTLTSATVRTQVPISLGGEVLSDFLGMEIAWTDDFTQQSAPTSLQIWQPSYIPKPETIADRISDWYDGGTPLAKYVQGFLLHADTFNAAKSLLIRDSDAMATHAFTPAVQHNGEAIKAYSFNTPFIAHQMRVEPADAVAWRFWDVDWVFEPTSESAETWKTQGTAHGLLGYMHIKQVSVCYASTSTITLTITSFDGQSPAPITLSSTSGAMQKVTFILTANKGQLFFYAATSSSPFQLFLDSWEILVGQWGRQDNYLRYRSLGATTGDQARV